MNDHDFFSVRKESDGQYIILRNGERFLTCSGTLEEAANITRLLNKDAERVKDEGQ